MATALTPPASAQTPNNSWIGSGGSGNWSDGGNWTASTPGAANVVGFDGTANLFQPTLDVDPTVAGLLMNGNNTLNLNGHTLTLTGLGTQTAGSITGAGTLAVTSFTPSGGTLGNGVTINASNNVTLSGVNFSGAIAGSGGLTTEGSVILGGGTSTYTGDTVVSSGSLQLAANNAISTASRLQISSGASLDLNGFGQSVTALSGAGSLALGSFGLTVDGTGTTTFTGTISGTGDLTKAGTGSLTLTGNNTYGGGTALNGGTLGVGSNTALGSGALTMAAGTTLQAASSVALTNAMALNGAASVDGNGNHLTLSGVISGPGSLTVTGGTVTLGGASTFAGGTTVAAGTLDLMGSLASGATVNAGAALTGTGTVGGNLAVSGTVAPTGANGTLTVAGTYIQNAGSIYQVDVNAAGQSDHINVGGAATINGGTVSVQAANGSYRRNTAYTILRATDGVTGRYTNVTSNFAFLAPSLSYNSDSVILSLLSTANSFQAGARTPNQRAVGRVLDLASPTTTTGDFATVLDAVYGLDTVQGPRVLDAISGQPYAAFGSLLMQGAQVFMDSFQVQAGGGQGPGGSAGLPGGGTYQALKVDTCNTANACDAEPLWGVWGGGVGAFGTVAGDRNASGATYNLGGFMAGLDRKLGSGFKVGVATGFNAASLYTNGVPGYGTSNTMQFAVYGEYLADAFYLDGLAGYAHSDNRMTRPIVIPGLAFRSAQGFTTANTFFGQLEGGYKIVVAPGFGGFVTPFARLQGATSTQNGFTESGADSLNLTVASQTTNSLRSVLGAQFGAALDAGWREKLSVVLRLGWSHEFADVSRPVNASFVGAPALGFTTFGAAAPRDGAILGLGANTTVAERTTVYLRYDGDLAGSNTNHVLSAGLRYVW